MIIYSLNRKLFKLVLDFYFYMKLNDVIKKKYLFVVLFIALVFIGKKINFSPLVGAENQFFTLFQFFGPIAGSFLGPLFGAISVLGAELIDFFVVGKGMSAVNLLRLTPMIFAAYYFGMKRKYSVGILVPLLAIGLFVLHPVGREVWFFSLYWLIPIVISVLPATYSQNLVLKSFGATFTAHAVGGALWVWTVPMTAAAWVTLIPIVAFERSLFALGIAGSYIAVNSVLDYVVEKFKVALPSSVLFLNEKWALLKRFSA